MTIKIKQLMEIDGKIPKIPYGGLYIISGSSKLTRNTLFKVGRSINLRSRLNSYHICFPEGFFIYALVIAIPVEPLVKPRTLWIQRTNTLEKELFRILNELAPNAKLHGLASGAKEAYRGLSPSVIKKSIAQLIAKHRSDINVKQTQIKDTSSLEGLNAPNAVAHVDASDFSLSAEERYDRDSVKEIDKAHKAQKKMKPKPKSKRVQPKRKVQSKTETQKIRQKMMGMNVMAEK
jgi:hypothetical protein